MKQYWSFQCVGAKSTIFETLIGLYLTSILCVLSFFLNSNFFTTSDSLLQSEKADELARKRSRSTSCCRPEPALAIPRNDTVVVTLDYHGMETAGNRKASGQR